METTKILTANFIDILFEGRNKEYGAYELRRNYEKRMWKALGITTAILLAIAGIIFLKTTFARPIQKITMTEHTIIDIKPIQDEKPDEIPPPTPIKKIDVPKVQTIKLTTPVVVDNDKVKEPPPAQSEIADAKISITTQEGVKYTGTVEPPEVVDNHKGILLTKKDNDNGGKPFEKVEIDAKYPGGAAAWKNFLERNLQGDIPVENGANTGNYTVIIQFVVDKAGNVSDIKALTNLGFGMEKEAIRVIKKSGKWLPAIQNGNEVTAYRKQPITFQVLEQ